MSNNTFMEMALALASDELQRSGLHFSKEKRQGYIFSSSPVLHCRYMKIMIENCRKLPKILPCSSMRVIISLYVQLIFLFVDGAVREAIMEGKQLICGHCPYGGDPPPPPYDSTDTRGVLFFLTQGLQSHVVSMEEEEEEEQYCPLW